MSRAGRVACPPCFLSLNITGFSGPSDHVVPQTASPRTHWAAGNLGKTQPCSSRPRDRAQPLPPRVPPPAPPAHLPPPPRPRCPIYSWFLHLVLSRTPSSQASLPPLQPPALSHLLEPVGSPQLSRSPLLPATPVPGCSPLPSRPLPRPSGHRRPPPHPSL